VIAADGFVSLLSVLGNALIIGAAVYVYGSLVRQIAARGNELEPGATRGFTWGDAVLAALLATWFVLNITAASTHDVSSMRTRDLALNALFSIALLIFVALFLRLRGIHIDTLAGFSRIGFRRAALTGAVLLVAAYPLIFLADAASQRVLGGGSNRQGIVELFNASNTLGQRILIIVLAVAIAPVAEEFLFRFFLYGVLKRYFGRVLALTGNALLFAAVHAHLPSFGPLFVLGSCFTLAFEWSGSILVPMTMHALFNSLTLTALAFPDLIQQ
jgi:membrane protease YdiL (CAAX protease family)